MANRRKGRRRGAGVSVYDSLNKAMEQVARATGVKRRGGLFADLMRHQNKLVKIDGIKRDGYRKRRPANFLTHAFKTAQQVLKKTGGILPVAKKRSRKGGFKGKRRGIVQPLEWNSFTGRYEPKPHNPFSFVAY